MQSRQIPGTDLTVSAICLGAGAFGSAVDQATAFQFLDHFFDAGGTFIDTARAYAIWDKAGAGASESVIGAWLRERRLAAHVVVSTKGGHPEWATLDTPRMTRRDLINDCEASLRALGLETISMYWLHRDDPSQPVESLLETLETLVQHGKIRYYGCSNWHSQRIREAQMAASKNGWRGFVANQPMWSLASFNTETMVDKTLVWMDSDLIQFHRQTKLAVIPYTAQARGVFSKVALSGWEGLSPDVRRDYDNPRNRETFSRLQQLAHEKAVSVTALALAWLIDNPDFVTIPIVSARSLNQWREILSSTNVRLTTVERVAILP